MVKLRPNKMNLEEGYTAPPTVFKNMGLYLDDVFENRKGQTLTVKEGNGEWRVHSVNGKE